MKKTEKILKTNKAPTRAPIKRKTSEPSLATLLKALQKTQLMVAETREQMAFMYGALEELAQRQEIQSQWQLNAVKQLLSASMPTPTGTKGRSFATSDGMAEIEILSDLPSGDNVAPYLVSELVKSAEVALEKLNDSRSDERTKGLQTLKDLVEANRAPENRTEEPTIMVVPRRDDVH